MKIYLNCEVSDVCNDYDALELEIPGDSRDEAIANLTSALEDLVRKYVNELRPPKFEEK